MSLLTVEQMREIVNAITYKPDWTIHLKDDGDRLYVQIEATTLDSITREPTTWKSGKNYLSPFMCRQEVVGVVFGAIEKAEIHEMREFFRYKGASIYNPHLDPEALVELASRKENFNMRDNAMSMDEPTKTHDWSKDTITFKHASGLRYTWHGDVLSEDGGQRMVSWGRTGIGGTSYRSIAQAEEWEEEGTWIVERVEKGE
ncbi:hypothetical protein D3C85_851500 [compost metagenome]